MNISQKPNAETRQVSYKSLIDVFAHIGILSFGGPAAQISLMHRILVDERNWIGERQFLNALSFCMLLPGPEAMQLATYTGWKLKGWLGGLISGLLFVLPGALVILGLAIMYANYGNAPLVASLFSGIKAAVLIVVIEALIKISKRALNAGIYWVLALIAFIGIFFFNIPFPLIVLGAGLIGFLIVRQDDHEETYTRPGSVTLSGTLKTVLAWLLIWWLPVFAIMFISDQQILTEISTFFSKLAVVTFGGAYAVLAYMGQDVVHHLGWLQPGEMIDGLGLAETTPGPLILVTEFVGFLAGFHEGGFWLGLSGALLTLWVTFVPCFLWIFAGAPYLDWISGQKRLVGALSAISAAVVGVMLNLSIWFGLHVYFENVQLQRNGLLHLWVPEIGTLNWNVVVISAICAIMVLWKRWNIIYVLLVAALANFAWEYMFKI